MTMRFKASSYFWGSSGKGPSGCLKSSPRGGEMAPLYCGNLSDPRTDPRIVANSTRAPQSAGAWSAASPTPPGDQSISDWVGALSVKASHTIPVHDKSEALIRIAVDTVRTLSNILHELWGCGRRFTVEGNGDGGSLQEFEEWAVFVDSEHSLVSVIPLSPSQPPGVRGNMEDIGRLNDESTPSRGSEKGFEYLQVLQP